MAASSRRIGRSSSGGSSGPPAAGAARTTSSRRFRQASKSITRPTARSVAPGGDISAEARSHRPPRLVTFVPPGAGPANRTVVDARGGFDGLSRVRLQGGGRARGAAARGVRLLRCGLARVRSDASPRSRPRRRRGLRATRRRSPGAATPPPGRGSLELRRPSSECSLSGNPRTHRAGDCPGASSSLGFGGTRCPPPPLPSLSLASQTVDVRRPQEDGSRMERDAEQVARVVLALEGHDLAEEVMHFLDRSGRARVVATATDERQLAEAIRQLEPDAVVASPALTRSPIPIDGRALLTVDTAESVAALRAAIGAGAGGFFLWPQERERLAAAAARVAPSPERA